MNEELKVGCKKISMIGIFKVLLMSLAWLWLCGALRYLMGVPSYLSFVILIGLPIYFYKSKKRRKHLFILATVLLLISVVLLIIKKLGITICLVMLTIVIIRCHRYYLIMMKSSRMMTDEI